MPKVLQITDLHIFRHPDECLLGVNTQFYFEQVVDQAHARHQQFDLILVTGDLAQTACDEAYQRIKTKLAQFETPFFCVAGNHDLPEVMQNTLTIQRRTTIGQWQIIGLHSPISGSPVGRFEKQELDELVNLLERHPNMSTLIITHHPCVPSGSAWMDTMQIQNSDEFWSLIANYPQVKAIVCGHIHQELNLVKNNVQVLATPATCFQFVSNSDEFAVAQTPPGYRVLEFNDETFTSYCEHIEAPEFKANPGASTGY